MTRRREDRMVVTLVLRTPDGVSWPLRLSRDCIRFVGRQRQIENFGPSTGLLHYLPGHIA